MHKLALTTSLLILAGCTPLPPAPVDTEGDSDAAQSTGDASTGADATTQIEPEQPTTTEVEPTTGEVGQGCDPITVLDANLLQAIRAALQVPGGPIEPAVAKTLTELIVSNDVASLIGIECFPNLTTLAVVGVQGQITSLAPLVPLKQLTTLIIRSHLVSDLTPLVGLGELRELSLGDGKISDLSPLVALPQLRELRVPNNAVDASTVPPLPALEQLDVSGNTLASLALLAGAPKLRLLAAQSTGTVDLTPLAGVSTLETIDVKDNQIVDLSPLAGLTALVELEADDNLIADVTPLTGLPALAVLSLERNQIADAQQFVGMSALKYLFLDDNTLTDVDPLAELPALLGLELSGNPLKTPTTLAPKLSQLSADDTGIDSLAFLTARPITFLSLRDNHIGDVTPLASLLDLEFASLTNNEITTLAPLAGVMFDQCPQFGVKGNPLDPQTLTTIIPALCAAGVSLVWDDGKCEC